MSQITAHITVITSEAAFTHRMALTKGQIAELNDPARGPGINELLVCRACKAFEMAYDPAGLSWKIELYEPDGSRVRVTTMGSADRASTHESTPALADPRIARCRSALSLAARVLPTGTREETLDEWADEIETAAAAERPIARRTLSIALRSLPALALRSRLPSRARRGGG